MKFLIADDHPIILVALTEMLATAFPDRISRIDTVSGGLGLLRRVNDTHYDYLTLDPEMPERPRGIPLLDAVRTARSSLKIIVYTGHASPSLALTAINLGAVAYVSKSSGPRLAIDAVRAVLDGQTFIDPSIDLDAARNHPWNHLTASEREVVLALGRGENMQALAIDSERSYKTVTTHKYNALRKLGLRSKAEIGIFLSRHGLDYLLD
jgi:two-component system capsular synthesis response regulator RcsB